MWIHADLLPPRALVHAGRPAAVIDFGAVGVDDPAADVIPASTMFGPAARATYRSALGVDDSPWPHQHRHKVLSRRRTRR